MIIKNASFIFDLLTNKLSRYKAVETIERSKWTNSNNMAGFGPILDCYSRKTIRIVISWCFLKQNSQDYGRFEF